MYIVASVKLLCNNYVVTCYNIVCSTPTFFLYRFDETKP